MAEEGVGFFIGVFTVVGGLFFIVGMGVFSIYNPYHGIHVQFSIINNFNLCSKN